MAFGDQEKKVCAELLEVMQEIRDLVEKSGEELYFYQGIDKIINIAKYCDPNGFKSIPKYLDGISTTLNDNKAFSRTLGRQLEAAHRLAVELY